MFFYICSKEKPQQNESSNSSSFIANSHSIFAATIPEPSIKPQLTGRQIAETILVPMIEQQIQLPSNERDLFVSLNNVLVIINELIEKHSRVL